VTHERGVHRRWPKVLTVTAALVVLTLVALVLVLTQPVLPPSGEGLQVQVEPARLRQDVEVLVGYSPRDLGNPATLAAAVGWIEGELAATGARMSRQDIAHRGEVFTNVIASYGPEDGERLVVGAHYDAVATTPGADDNASGVAGLLALGRLFQHRAPARRVDLVAYTLEEFGMVGSRAHAAALRQANVEVRLMLSLEMIGYFDDAPGSQKVPLRLIAPLYPNRGDFITVVGRLGDIGEVREVKRAMKRGDPQLSVESINAPRALQDINRSDHASFWDHGYRALMITDTANLRNPHYHRPSDVPQTLDYERMAKVVRQVYAAVLELGGG
jgi:hypothetical protein